MDCPGSPSEQTVYPTQHDKQQNATFRTGTRSSATRTSINNPFYRRCVVPGAFQLLHRPHPSNRLHTSTNQRGGATPSRRCQNLRTPPINTRRRCHHFPCRPVVLGPTDALRNVCSGLKRTRPPRYAQKERFRARGQAHAKTASPGSTAS